MLVLTVKLGHSVMIGDVRVEFKQIKGKQIRLGIEAPEKIHIQRIGDGRPAKSPPKQIQESLPNAL